MDVSGDIVFPPFRLDLSNERLWRDAQEVVLRPKTFALLRHMVHHAGRVVKKEELLKALWPGTSVGDDGLMVCVRELRRALGDDSRTPQFIETLRKRGYRFIAPVVADAAPVSRSTSHVSRQETAEKTAINGRDAESLETRNEKPETLLVGRTPELAQLQHLLEKALRGERQVMFVTGETGIGKTTLVDAFLAQLRDRADVRITSGQCVEQYGPGEAYLPLLEATARLCRGPGGERRIVALQRYAPSWLVQLPSLLEPQEFERLQHRVQGTSRERMLREMAEAAEGFAATRTVVLVLEDLHWSDVSTLDWVTYMARRRGPARLLILGTYRPADVLASNHPLHGVVQELEVRSQCEVLRLAPLAEEAITEYLALRLNVDVEARQVVPRQFIPLLHHRTGGNPLFLVNTVDDLIRQGVFVEQAGQPTLRADAVKAISESIPDTVRQLIKRQLERLPESEQQLLEAASVAGVEFVAAEAAAGLLTEEDNIEATCEKLARTGQWTRETGVAEWPDGTISGRYSFRHALYHEVVYARVAEARRLQLHRRIAERKEVAYGERVGEIAGELAVHFEKGRDLTRAVHYLGKAGETAVRRSAHQEAIAHFTRGLDLLATFPDTPERKQHELALQVALGVPLVRTKGYAAPEVAHAYGRARELCQQIGEQPDLFPALAGLCSFYVVRAELQTARMLAEQCLRLAQQVQDSALLVEAHFLLGVTLLYRGELTSAQAILEQGSAFYDPQAHGSLMLRYGQDPGVACHAYASLTRWLLGYPDQALGKNHDALSLARELSHAFSVGAALHTAAWLHQYRQDGPAVQAYAEEEIGVAHEGGFALWLAAGTSLRGWALSEQGAREEGLAQMREGMAALNAIGTAIAQPYQLALLAQAHGKSGQAQEGVALLDQALAAADTTGERYYEAELYRLRGELTLAQSKTSPRQVSGKSQASQEKSEDPNTQHLTLSTQAEVDAEACFLKAIAIAQKQQAKSLELRAATSLARLWQQRNKIDDARELLEEVYNWFTEGFDTKDLQDAAALLRELGGTEENQKSKIKRQKAKQAEGLRLKAEGPLLSSPSSLQPLASSLSQSSVLSPQPLSSLIPPPQPLAESSLPTSDLGPRTSDAVFRPEGDYWTLAFDGKVCRVRDMRGLHYLAYLLQHPNDDIHAFRLVSGDAANAAPSLKGSRAPAADHLSIHASDSGEVLDAQARAAYKQRIADLQAELDEAETFHDQGRIDTVREQLEFLTQELAQAVGLGGRARRAGSPAERARTTATKAMKNALKKIREHHASLGQYLTHTIKTGTFCVYAPDPRFPVPWQF